MLALKGASDNILLERKLPPVGDGFVVEKKKARRVGWI